MTLERETIQRIARELLGIEVSASELDVVVPEVIAWQGRFERIEALDLTSIEPAFLESARGS